MKDDNTYCPFVSALLVARNEHDYVEKALMSLINQTYPHDCYEIIVVDGGSTDGTLDIVNSLIEQYTTKGLDIRVIHNPKKILATGWNLGIINSRGSFVIRIDSHAEAAVDFIEKSVQTIQSIPEAVCVGGRLITKSLPGGNDTVSKVLSSPFGVGNSSFRVSETAGFSDTAVYGLYRKTIFNEIGLFNEGYIRNQDIELHSRIKKAGGKFYFNPEIKCVYYSRNTLKKMVKQAYGNGKWNMVLLKHNRSALKIRHLVPFCFVLFLIVSTITGFIWWPSWCIEGSLVVLHLLMGTYFGAKKTNSFIELMRMPFLFLILHLSYGTGYLAGLFKKIKKQ